MRSGHYFDTEKEGSIMRGVYYFDTEKEGSIMRGVYYFDAMEHPRRNWKNVYSTAFTGIRIGVNMKKIYFLVLIAVMAATTAISQEVNKTLAKGNENYRKGEFDKAIEQYRIVLEKDPGNKTANYNLANALFRTGKFSEAENLYNEGLEGNEDRLALHKAYYNKGVALTKQQKLEESVEAYKQAILLDPTDEDTRFNLQKALVELRKRQQADKKEEQDKDQKKQQQPQKPQSKLSKRQVENLLKSLQQREQEAQKKMQQSRRRGVTQPEKDW